MYSNDRIVAAIDALSKVLNKRISFSDVGAYYDNYVCGTYLSREVLPIFNGEYAREFKYIYILDLYINLFLTDLQIKTTSNGYF